MFWQNKRPWPIVAIMIALLAILAAGSSCQTGPQPPVPSPTPQVASSTSPSTVQTASPTSLPAAGSISGKVLTSDGVTPISEVGILAKGDATQSLEAAVTGLDGTYMLDNLLPDTDTITVIIPGYETIETGGIILQNGQKIASLDFALRRESSISGKVTRADGTPLANVSILASTSGGEMGAAVTAADGTYKVEGLLATGAYQVEAFCEGYGFAPAEATILNEGDDIVGVDLYAFKGVITGKITKADGTTPIAGGTVSVQIDSSAQALPSVQRMVATATTGEDGSYRLESLQPAAYTLQVFSPDYGIEIRPVQVPDDVNGVKINVSLRPAGSISGRVTQADGKPPMSGVKISILDSDNHLVKLPQDIVTNQNGEFTIGNLAEGKYAVMADVTASVSIVKSDVVVSAGQETTNVDLCPDQAGGTISGKVYRADGVTPVEQALVIAASETAGGSAFTAADGTYRISGLPAGIYYVIATAQGYESQSQSGIPISIGETTSNIDFGLSAKVLIIITTHPISRATAFVGSFSTIDPSQANVAVTNTTASVSDRLEKAASYRLAFTKSQDSIITLSKVQTQNRTVKSNLYSLVLYELCPPDACKKYEELVSKKFREWRKAERQVQVAKDELDEANREFWKALAAAAAADAAVSFICSNPATAESVACEMAIHEAYEAHEWLWHASGDRAAASNNYSWAKRWEWDAWLAYHNAMWELEECEKAHSCPIGTSCCNPDKKLCCSTQRERCCGDHCCPKDQRCCGAGCCPVDQTCCDDRYCCPKGEACAGECGCCPIGLRCCGKECCKDCNPDGTCSTQGGLGVLPPIFASQGATVETVSPQGDTIIFDNQAIQLSFPPGAVSSAASIVYLPQPKININGFKVMRLFNLEAYTGGCQWQKFTDFNKPVTIQVSYSPEEITGIDESKLGLYYFDNALNQWVALPSAVDPATDRVTVNELSYFTLHFTLYALMAPVNGASH